MQIRMTVVPKKNFKKCLSIFLVKWVYHKLYIFKFHIFDTNWPSLLYILNICSRTGIEQSLVVLCLGYYNVICCRVLGHRHVDLGGLEAAIQEQLFRITCILLQTKNTALWLFRRICLLSWPSPKYSWRTCRCVCSPAGGQLWVLQLLPGPCSSS